MSDICAFLIIVILVLVIPAISITILVRAIMKKTIKKLAITLAICVGSIIPLTILGVLTDPATWCDHEYEILQENAPTCTKKGEIHKHCPLCENDKVEYIDTTPHQWITDSIVDVSCTSGGYTIEVCKVCSATQKTNRNDALGHFMKEVSRIEPTTSSEGKIVSRCERCGYDEIVVLSKLEETTVPSEEPNKNAPQKTDDGVLKYILSDDKSYYIVNGVVDCSVTMVTIPDTWYNIPVKVIGKDAFKNCRSLASITIPESITSIEDAAFNGTSLKKVYITDIAAWCNISFESVVSNPLRYADNLYLNGEYVKEIVIPDGVTSIGAHAFDGYSNLVGISIPESVNSIGYSAFRDCISLKNVYITDLVAWCNISFDGSNATPLNKADNLYLNGEIVKELKIPTGVTSISSYAFHGYTGLASVTFHDRVTNIGNCAFANCINLTSITISDSVTSIGGYAFYNCYKLKSFILGTGVAKIGDFALDNCNSLETVNYKGNVEQWNLIQKNVLWDGYTSQFKICCSDGTISKNGVVTYD